MQINEKRMRKLGPKKVCGIQCKRSQKRSPNATLNVIPNQYKKKMQKVRRLIDAEQDYRGNKKKATNSTRWSRQIDFGAGRGEVGL